MSSLLFLCYDLPSLVDSIAIPTTMHLLDDQNHIESSISGNITMKVKNGYFVNVAKIGTIKQFVASGGLSHCQGCTYLYIWSCGVSGQKRSVCPEVECLARRGVSVQKWSVWPIYINTHTHLN